MHENTGSMRSFGWLRSSTARADGLGGYMSAIVCLCVVTFVLLGIRCHYLD